MNNVLDSCQTVGQHWSNGSQSTNHSATSKTKCSHLSCFFKKKLCHYLATSFVCWSVKGQLIAWPTDWPTDLLGWTLCWDVALSSEAYHDADQYRGVIFPVEENSLSSLNNSISVSFCSTVYKRYFIRTPARLSVIGGRGLLQPRICT